MSTPELHNNRVLVPLRFVIENFDAFTFWDRELREVTFFVLPMS
ncbi:MAG: copper amine oxidase N-terminal domain-containing protein [Defluviitaleaceae bacterium]|nr:copper amine oxidase N-terminal domain-containing protein [Defluviitaleaceae bacterium]